MVIVLRLRTTCPVGANDSVPESMHQETTVLEYDGRICTFDAAPGPYKATTYTWSPRVPSS